MNFFLKTKHADTFHSGTSLSTVCFGGVWGRIAWRWKRKLGKKANSRGKVKTGNLSFKPLKIDRWLQFDSLTWLKYRFLFFDICCTSHGKSVMTKSPGLAITKEREMGSWSVWWQLPTTSSASSTSASSSPPPADASVPEIHNCTADVHGSIW